MLVSDDFPAPLGPMMAVNWEERKQPSMQLRIVLKPTVQQQKHS